MLEAVALGTNKFDLVSGNINCTYLFIVEVIVAWRVSRCVNSSAETLISTFGVIKYAVLTPTLCVSRMFHKSNEK